MQGDDAENSCELLSPKSQSLLSDRGRIAHDSFDVCENEAVRSPEAQSGVSSIQSLGRKQ